ncbi:class I SAM-dependent methyltransferase [Amycolatopsis pittospori]|uniref:class I SAM-dependent methyltransferase n=1 Tax=Amycolatopsis pittospori TaxID=2749434 RepID=UPI0015F0D4D5|nr:class I SAM-dependent methyltransferase [Amycolatopsis pittospori]
MTDQTRRSYDLVADRYAEELGDELRHKPLDRALLDAFAEFVQGGTVADIGCGPGQVAAHLATRGLQVVGLDLSTSMCDAVRRRTSLPACAADMTALPVRAEGLAGLVCLYATIHLDDGRRAVAYREFARVLRPGAPALLSFHVSDADFPAGGVKTLDTWWDHDVALDFRFLDPDTEISALRTAGFALVARLDRGPHAGVEHPSERCSLLLRRTAIGQP